MNPLEKYRERTREKLLADFPAFARQAWKVIESKPLEWGWHHQLIAENLQLAYEREIRRLIIAVPPRSGKSRLTNVIWPAWCWAKDASLNFLTTSYSDSLSEELSVLRRRLLQSRWFQETFPGKVLFASDQNRREQYGNLAHGMMIATSGTGTALGKGCDFLIADDALSPQSSFSDLERESVNRDFDSTFRSRLNDPERGVIVIIAQRLHERDLIGHVLESEPNTWVNLTLPMIAETDEEIVFPVSGRIIPRKAGDLLHPARFPAKWCEKQKNIIGSYLWSSQYQQRPGVLGGAVFQKKWFREYTNLPEKNIRTILSLDTAYSIKRTADLSVASVWVAQEGKFYLAWVWRERCEYPRLKYMTQELYDTWAPDTILIEEKGSGQSLLQSLQQETSLPVIGVPAVGDKISRGHSTTALFESGRIFFPKDASWLPTFLHELELFPAGAHDDQVDSLTQALLYLRSQQSDGRLTWIDVSKQKAAEWTRGIFTQKKQSRYVAIRTEAGGKQIEETGIPSSCMHCGSFKLESCGTGQSTRLHCLSCGKYSWGELYKYPCPKCGDALTGVVGGGKWRCQACGHHFTPGVAEPETEQLGCEPGCAGFVRQVASGRIRCGNCGRYHTASPVVVGMSREQYNNRRKKFWN
jgi:predicted phage terminase large subunit-like protein